MPALSTSPLDLTPAQLHEIRFTLGPMQIGNFLNSILLGVLFLQVGQYFQNFRDPLWIRALVLLTLIIDVAQSAQMMFMTWEYSVTHFGDFTFLGASIWALSSIPFYSVPVSWIVQGFYAWRIWIITKVKWWSFMVIAFAIVQGAFGIYAGIGSFLANSTADNVTLQHIAIVWFIFAMLCDVSIMVIMIWSLSQSKTGFKDTDTLITKINRSILETGAATSATVLMDCLFLFLIPGTDMHLVPVMAVGKVYSNSFLYLLNSRNTYRNVSSIRLGTTEFARSLDRSGAQPNGGTRITAGTSPAGSKAHPRGLHSLKFAPNQSMGDDEAMESPRENAVTPESGVYVSHETYVMSSMDGREDDGAYKRSIGEHITPAYTIDTDDTSANPGEDRKVHYV
ncbi:hypothetical protein DL93DRAFT_121743 [Clavulina sp. PMI_390]|nr:hypothetical protein DL93DRAFT_121743 [Clavulina sp. PMI_390]